MRVIAWFNSWQLSTVAGSAGNLLYIAATCLSTTSVPDSGGFRRISSNAKKAGVEKVGTKSIINIRRSSICWRGRRELITDVRKPEIMVMTSLQAESCYWLLRSPSQHALNPKLKSTGAGRCQLAFPLVGCLPQATAWKTSPEKWDAVALQQIKERGALPMIDRGDIRRAIDRCSNIWASAGRWLWSVRA